MKILSNEDFDEILSCKKIGRFALHSDIIFKRGNGKKRDLIRT
jgi:hypothetical protein